MPGHWYMRLLDGLGQPFDDPDSVTRWLLEGTGNALSAAECVMNYRCSVCMRGTHKTRKCPLLTTMNKHRAKKSLLPIEVAANRLLTAAVKKPLTLEALEKDVQQVVRDLRAKIGTSSSFEVAALIADLGVGDLEKRLAAVEKGTGGKRKEQPAPPAAQPAKKAKEDTTNVREQVREQAKASGSGLRPAERLEEVPNVAPRGQPAARGGKAKRGRGGRKPAE